ncbi:MAG: hypothetical protein AAF288_06385 [Planctomycetota bacterium]
MEHRKIKRARGLPKRPRLWLATAGAVFALAGATAWACGGSWAWSGWLGRGTRLVVDPPGVSKHGASGAALRSWELLDEPEPEMRRAGRRLGSATTQTELSELAERLGELGAPRHQIAQQVAAYAAFRQSLDAQAMPRAKGRRPAIRQPVAAGEPPAPLAGLPAEFDLYARGAAAYRFGLLEEARGHWRALLALPEDQRRYRSVWAAYMLGRSDLTIDAGQAEVAFIRAIDLSDRGFVDALGLAGEAWGWRGRLAMDRGDWSAGIEAYRAHWRQGGEVRSSLIAIAERVLGLNDADMARAAADPAVRNLVTRVVASRPPWWWEMPASSSDRWLAALESAGGVDAQGAAQAAVAAYRAGRWDLAERWAGRAGEASALGQWVRAKLAVRAGEHDAGVEHLRRAIALLRQRAGLADGAGQRHSPAWYGPNRGALDPAGLSGELGVLLTQRGDLTEALGAFVAAGLHADAAYLAEQVLTVDEVAAFCRQARRSRKAQQAPGNGESPQGVAQRGGTHGVWLENVLARRLARLERHDEALQWFTPSMRTGYRSIVADLELGHDPAVAPAERADALWRAARTTFFEGQAYYAVSSEPLPHVEKRYRAERGARAARLRLGERSPGEVGAEERARWDGVDARGAWERTFPYLAARRAWQATLLMPNEDPETARRLCLAGTWLRVMDPPAADAFYKALVIRCGQTPLGAEADRLRWLPRLTDDPDYGVK